MAARFLTDDAMRRPLFVEQPEDSVRSDPYSSRSLALCWAVWDCQLR